MGTAVRRGPSDLRRPACDGRPSPGSDKTQAQHVFEGADSIQTWTEGFLGVFDRLLVCTLTRRSGLISALLPVWDAGPVPPCVAITQQTALLARARG